MGQQISARVRRGLNMFPDKCKLLYVPFQDAFTSGSMSAYRHSDSYSCTHLSYGLTQSTIHWLSFSVIEMNHQSIAVCAFHPCRKSTPFQSPHCWQHPRCSTQGIFRIFLSVYWKSMSASMWSYKQGTQIICWDLFLIGFTTKLIPSVQQKICCTCLYSRCHFWDLPHSWAVILPTAHYLR